MRHTFALLFATFALSASAQHEVVLHLNLKNVQPKDTLTLCWGANNKSVTPVITTIIPTETSEVSLPLNEPRVVLLKAKGQGDELEMLLTPGEDVTISGRIRSNNHFILNKLRVKGASAQWQYAQILQYYKESVDSIDEQVKSEFKDVIRAIENGKKQNNEQAIANIYQTKRGQEYIERIIGTFHERQEILDDIIIANKDTYMGPLMMIRLMGRLSKANRDMYNRMSDAAKLSYYGREVKDEVYPPTLVGDIAPTVTVKNTEGKDKVLSFIRHGNRYLLLDFWASWCEPCRNEVPNLKALYQRYHDKGLDIIGISADQHFEDWKNALDDLNEPWCNYIDQNRQAIGEYKVQYIPSIFIIDKEGNIIAEKIRGKELHDYIDKLFSE